jgi:AcrR family transcriptional regulator
MAVSEQASLKRPRDRKAQIADAAAGLFRELGYHRVGVEDIAASVGITGRAIYRHFANKQDLLAQVVLGGIAQLEAAVEQQIGANGDGTAQLDDVVRTLTSVSLEQRNLGVLIRREARHLDDAQRREVQRRADAVVLGLGRGLRRARPELPATDADLLVRSTLAVLASPSYHTVPAPRGAELLLFGMARGVLSTDALPRPEPKEPVPSKGRADTVAGRASRREAVLAVAIELLAQRGYAGVRMEDVGAAAGIAGPSVYEHFAGKPDLLMAALTRGAEWLELGLTRALAAGSTPVDTLERVQRSYVDFMFQHTDLMGVFLSETIYLPDEERHALRRVQHEYVSEWVRLLVAVRPDLTQPEARFVVHGVLGLVNDYVQGGRRHRRPDLGDVLVQIGSEVLAG